MGARPPAHPSHEDSHEDPPRRGACRAGAAVQPGRHGRRQQGRADEEAGRHRRLRHLPQHRAGQIRPRWPGPGGPGLEGRRRQVQGRQEGAAGPHPHGDGGLQPLQQPLEGQGQRPGHAAQCRGHQGGRRQEAGQLDPGPATVSPAAAGASHPAVVGAFLDAAGRGYTFPR
ncbi:hypothetical protein RA210_U10713 [Rubrivivax sp. A210]|nr:hypothetical protein RA210_U10713 [Rubrivivax sp. A210]